MRSSIPSSFFFVLIVFTLIQLRSFVKAIEPRHDECKRPIQCGNISIGYPFYDDQTRPEYCGYPGYRVNCSYDQNMAEISVTTSSSEVYYLLSTSPNSNIITVAREDYSDNLCPENLSNASLNFSLYNYTSLDEYVTLHYECSEGFRTFGNQFSCMNMTNGTNAYFMTRAMESNLRSYVPPWVCQRNVSVPVNRSIAASITDTSSLQAAFRSGFELEWIGDNGYCVICRDTGGVCGYNTSLGRFACYCANDVHDSRCDGNSSKKGIIIGLAVGGVGLLAAALACSVLVVQRRRRSVSKVRSKDVVFSNPSTGNPSSNDLRSSQAYSTSPSGTYLSNSSSYPSSKSDFENSASYFGIKVFSYNELEEATENFHVSRELGNGGFGIVYYGKLNDGRLVAVKRLYENSCRHMGQFMNEIRILAHLRHKNLVTLYGCTSRRSRELLLVYEYIPNGTVADHLHGKLAKSNVLPWSTRLKIAVETAEALSFLHEMEVVHRDVKTTNILLDNTFQVKVADFGLSRLFPTDVTHVSTAPQGTPGYVDPEYYQCYQLTEKSDVFSFGVVLAELISSKVAVDITRHRHDINLANMTVDRIHKQALDELIDPKLELQKDILAEKMVKLVAELAFRCLQQERDARPSMKEVLETLIGIQTEVANEQKQVVVDIHGNNDIGL